MQVVDLLTVPLAVDLAKEEGASISPLTSVSRGSDSAALNKAAVVLTHSAQKEEGGASGERRPLSIDGEGSTEKTDTSAGDCFFQPVRYCRTTLPRKPSKVQMSQKGTYMKETLFLEKKCKKRLDRLDKDVYSL
ncbi:hypothetical protein AGDE_14230 [Angomonas deanei]|uniref:Uncharacterized protein n=1 Tax=Angomonas deanei TaxID=59799 RepID=A0A7G2CMJ3_9TRYP|nr:hypothetical protein AGDE_14230 [Angomonas deanei]CAD2221060.1 hypothetical protein, conserved [Angomonas deanei]|eukprot:EPY21195.1 hypothetical protein AGDE_14230 [Angomonas deanei]